MDPALETALQVGERHPAPVLPLRELLDQVEGTLGELPEECRSLDGRLRSRDDLFRVLNPWRGPLRLMALDPLGAGEGRDLLEAHGLPRKAWVVTRRPPSEARDRDRIREGVAAFARAADDGSLRSLLRLARILREERALRLRGI